MSKPTLPAAILALAVVLVLVFGPSAWQIIASLVSDVGHTAIAPNIHLDASSFTAGPCRAGSWGPFPWGQITDIQANVTLTNSGYSSGFATVAFMEDGSALAQHEFYVQAGQTTAQTWQLQVGDCGSHTYSAQITGQRSG